MNACVVPGCGSRSDRDHHLYNITSSPTENNSSKTVVASDQTEKNVPLHNNSWKYSMHVVKWSHKMYTVNLHTFAGQPNTTIVVV